MPISRLALITPSAPWEGNPFLGTYNWHQANAFNRLGVKTEIFVPSLTLPRFLERFSAGLRRVNARPAEYDYKGVKGHGFKAYVPHPTIARQKMSPIAPAFTGRWHAAFFEKQMLPKFQSLNPDVLLVQDGLLLGELANRLSRRLGIPWGLIEHETMALNLDSRIGRYYAQVASSARAIFIAHGPSLERMHQMGLKQAHLLVNGSVMATDEQRRTPRPAKWEGKKIVLCVGFFGPVKGQVPLARAFAEANVPDSILVMVGGRTPPPEIFQAMRNAGMADRLEILSPMPQEQLQQYMAWADLYAMPSQWESFGLVFAEAMAAETPIICTTSCGISTFIQPGVHGWIVPPDQHAPLVAALKEALTTADLHAMGRAGRALVEQQFSWERNARQVLEAMDHPTLQ